MTDKYEPMFKLGSGAFGTAWVVKTKDKGEMLVSKIIKIAGLSSKDIDNCVTEVVVLRNCHHANIVRYIDAFVDSGALHIIMEYATGGDLHQKIERQAGKYFPNQVILGWFVQVLLALEYIHGKNILHRDLKPRNVFLTSDGTVKLGDFGIARVLTNTLDLAHTQIGTPFYISPEICDNKLYNNKTDMWAAGCLLYELCLHKVPFMATSVSELSERIRRGRYDSLPRQFGSTIPFIISHLLLVSSDDRLSASEILKIQEVRTYVVVSRKVDSDSSKCQRSRSVHRPPVVNRALAQHRSYSENRGKRDLRSRPDSNLIKDNACVAENEGKRRENFSNEASSHIRMNEKGKNIGRLSSVDKKCDDNGKIQKRIPKSSKEIDNNQESKCKGHNKVNDQFARDNVLGKENPVFPKKIWPGRCNNDEQKVTNATALEKSVSAIGELRYEQLESTTTTGSRRSERVGRGSRNHSADVNCINDIESNVDEQKQSKYSLKPTMKVEKGFNKIADDADSIDARGDKIIGNDKKVMANNDSRWPDSTAVKSRTYTVNTSVLRRLSDLSPKLYTTVRKQRFVLSVSDPSGLCAQVPSPYDTSHCDEADCSDTEDVFSSPISHSQGSSPSHRPQGTPGVNKLDRLPVCSKTYTIQDANNNSGHTDDMTSIDDLNSVLVLALSTSRSDTELSSQILQQALSRRLGEARATQLIHQVTQLVVEEGQSYPVVKNIFMAEELQLFPLVVMCCFKH